MNLLFITFAMVAANKRLLGTFLNYKLFYNLRMNYAPLLVQHAGV